MKDTSQTSEVGETFDLSSRSVKETDVFDPFGLGAAASGVLGHRYLHRNSNG
jgi:hypothetical protein